MAVPTFGWQRLTEGPLVEGTVVVLPTTHPAVVHLLVGPHVVVAAHFLSKDIDAIIESNAFLGHCDKRKWWDLYNKNHVPVYATLSAQSPNNP